MLFPYAMKDISVFNKIALFTNLNQFELNINPLYGIQLGLLIFNSFKGELIIILNIFIFIHIAKKIYTSFYVLNLSKIINWK